MLKRVLLKLSGEALSGQSGFGIDKTILQAVIAEIQQLLDAEIEIGIVVGGGNFFRGLQGVSEGMDRVGSDHIGMLATAMNALALQQAFQAKNVSARVLSALPISGVAEPYVRARALKHLEEKRVVIFAAGTGNPLFTTDSAASLRAIEINADVMIKATRVDGVYSADPEKDDSAVKFDQLTFREVLDKNLRVMDLTAITLCQENGMPIRVLNIHEPGSLLKAVKGELVGTWIS